MLVGRVARRPTPKGPPPMTRLPSIRFAVALAAAGLLTAAGRGQEPTLFLGDGPNSGDGQGSQEHPPAAQYRRAVLRLCRQHLAERPDRHRRAAQCRRPGDRPDSRHRGPRPTAASRSLSRATTSRCGPGRHPGPAATARREEQGDRPFRSGPGVPGADAVRQGDGRVHRQSRDGQRTQGDGDGEPGLRRAGQGEARPDPRPRLDSGERQGRGVRRARSRRPAARPFSSPATCGSPASRKKGWVAVTVDGYERAFLFETAFDGSTPQRPPVERRHHHRLPTDGPADRKVPGQDRSRPADRGPTPTSNSGSTSPAPASSKAASCPATATGP